MSSLREKQKARRIYGVLERQFRGYFHKAERQKAAATGTALLQMLECVQTTFSTGSVWRRRVRRLAS